MEVAAATVAFVTVALQATKLICTTLSGISEAPEDVQRILNAVSCLEGVLKQIGDLQSSAGAYATLFSSLYRPMGDCFDDLRKYEKELEKIDSKVPKGPRRTWKKFKALLKEKDLRKFEGVICMHHNKLQTCLLLAGM